MEVKGRETDAHSSWFSSLDALLDHVGGFAKDGASCLSVDGHEEQGRSGFRAWILRARP
jgi:hypothetical protein